VKDLKTLKETIDRILCDLQMKSEEKFDRYKEDTEMNAFDWGYAEGVDYAIEKLKELLKEVEK